MHKCEGQLVAYCFQIQNSGTHLENRHSTLTDGSYPTQGFKEEQLFEDREMLFHVNTLQKARFSYIYSVIFKILIGRYFHDTTG